MRTTSNKLNILFLLLSVAFLTACEKDISDDKIGIENVYIPQAISASTSDNNYAVPGNINFGAAKNFKDDEVNNKVQIYLGVAKSGKQETQPFTVDITSRADTINQLITAGAGYLLLPSNAYTLPTNVSLATGQTTANFNMLIDKSSLKTYSGKKVAVCITLSNPTRYSLSAKTKKVIVIVDVDALKLK